MNGHIIEVLISIDLVTGEGDEDPHSPEVQRIIDALRGAGFSWVDYGALVSTEDGDKQELVFDMDPN